MKILLLTSGLCGIGGIQLVNRMLHRILREYTECQQLVVLGYHDLSHLDQPSLIGAAGSKIRLLSQTAAQLVRNHWDLIVVTHVHLVPLTLGKHRRTRVIVFIHGIEVWQALSRLQRYALQRASLLLSISHFTLQKILDYNPGLTQIRCEVCPLGLDFIDIPPHNYRQQENYILSLGRMNTEDAYKGFDQLIRCWPNVQKLRPDLQLWIAGDGNDRSRLEILAQGTQSIRFFGPVSDQGRSDLLAGARGFAMPSRKEGFGLVFLEAMMARLPVLAGNCDASPEVVVDRVTGRLVDPDHLDELTQGILDIASDQGPTWGLNGLERYHNHFTFELFRDRVISHLQRVMA
jgi:glycosyltransferase involved in cell wall biosynthesis